MRLGLAGREYATWTISPDISMAHTFSVSFDHGATWTPMARLDATTIQVLVAGPGATGNPAGTVVLVAGTHRSTVKLDANPEIVIRDAGQVTVTASP